MSSLRQSPRFLIPCLTAAFIFWPGAAHATSNFSVGVEGFRDHYQEPTASVDTHTNYGSVTASYEHAYNTFFSAIDGRYSSGKSDYKSDSGTLNGEKELETDLRVRTGLSIALWHGHFMPYVGLGWRYYFDQGKGLATSTGALAYDRHISQFYVPIGASYPFTSGDWTYTPMLEFDPLAWGHVSSHFGFTGLEPDVTNIQHSGWGVRGEFMAGQQYKYFSWEGGPFFRYWDIPQSRSKMTPDGDVWVEPDNTRLQAGLALRIIF